jgi:hypothetical protein
MAQLSAKHDVHHKLNDGQIGDLYGKLGDLTATVEKLKVERDQDRSVATASVATSFSFEDRLSNTKIPAQKEKAATAAKKTSTRKRKAAFGVTPTPSKRVTRSMKL